MNPMTAVVPGPGLPPSGTPTISSPAPTPAELRGTESEQPLSTGGVRADDPSGLGVFLVVAYFDGHSTGDEGGTGVPKILDDLGTVT
jgi:hypothetical protein